MIIWAIAIILFIAILVIALLLNFYKDPKRIIPKGNNIVAPADGTVISIIDTSNKEFIISKGFLGKIKSYTKDISNNCYVISIFMSPFDAHYNRAPIDGMVKYTKHEKGRFFKAYDLEKSFQNEKNEILIQNEQIKVKVIQIAGFLARRIKCYVKANQKVNKGAKIGMIALGSQTTLILPKFVEIKVKYNDKVKAGESVIAHLGDKNG